jgi:hypothetical protein
MDYYSTLVFIFIVSAISFYIDKYRGYSFKSDTLLFTHHWLNIFANFGWVTTSVPLLHLYIFAPIIVSIHWLTNKGKCILTEEYNRMCGLPATLQFNDLFNILGFKQYTFWNNIGHYLYLAIALFLTAYKLYTK